MRVSGPRRKTVAWLREAVVSLSRHTELAASRPSVKSESRLHRLFFTEPEIPKRKGVVMARHDSASRTFRSRSGYSTRRDATGSTEWRGFVAVIAGFLRVEVGSGHCAQCNCLSKYSS